MNKPKLLLIADTYYPKVDGTLRFMEEFIKRAKEFNIALLVPDLGKNVGQNVTYVKTSKWFSLSGYPSLKFSCKNFRIIKQLIKEAEIVFIQGPALLSYFSILYGHRYHKRTVFYLHVLPWELIEKFMPTSLLKKLLSRLVKYLALKSYNYCDEIIVPYFGLKEQLRSAGVKSEISVAQLGVDITRFVPTKDKSGCKRKLDLPAGKTIIGYVGRISKEKNIEVLLKAFRKLPDQKKYHLLLVGDGPEEQLQMFKELKNCTITGFVDNVQDYLRAMDIFVMPSLTETTSLATLEAMSCGLPVIVTKIGYMKKYVVKNENGLFFPKNSPTVLAMKIEQVLKDEELRHRLARNARRTVAYSFSWERTIKKIKKYLLRQYYS